VSLGESPTKIEEQAFSRLFEQNFTTGSYEVKIERAWCCQKAWEKSGSRVPKKKIKKKSYPWKLPKQRTTKIWFQGILGVKKYENIEGV
jgi:hypothetical protein